DRRCARWPLRSGRRRTAPYRSPTRRASPRRGRPAGCRATGARSLEGSRRLRWTAVWDFDTEPEFQAKLDWMRAFIDNTLVPLEPIQRELPRDEWKVVKAYLQDQVKEQGLWGAFLDPKLGGPGFGQLKLALMSEIIGRC